MKLLILSISVLLYIALIIVWINRFPISYKKVGGNYRLIKDRDLTMEEIASIDKAFTIRQKITSYLLYGSVLLALGSGIAYYKRLFEPRLIAKIVMIVAGAIAIILILIGGISFIPSCAIG